MKNDTGQLGVLAEKCAKNLRFPYACGLIEVFGHIRARTCGPTRTRIPPFNLSPRVRAEDFIIIDLDSVQHGTASLLPGQTPSQLEINKSCPDDGSLGGSPAVYPTRFGMSDPPCARTRKSPGPKSPPASRGDHAGHRGNVSYYLQPRG